MKLKSLLALILAMIMVMGVMSGCANDDTDQPDETPKQEETKDTTEKETEKKEEEPAEPMELTLAHWDLKGFEDADKYGTKIEEDLNVIINPVTWEWGKHRDQAQLKAVSGELPDAYGSYSMNGIELPRFYSWIEQGLIRSIPEELINKYPTIKSYVENSPAAQAVKTVHGEYFMIPRPDTTMFEAKWKTFYYRKDWMENVGITKVPETVDEYYELLKAYTFDDPDQNGKDDTYGLTIDNNVSSFDILGIWGIDPESWVYEDGRWIPGYISDECIDGLAFLQKLFKEGILDPEFTSNNSKAVEAKLTTNTFGSILRNADYGTLNKVIKNKFGAANTDIENPLDVIGLLPPLKENKHGEATWVQFVGIGAVEINADVDDEKLDKILELMEYTVAEENKDFMSYGFEGEDYDVVDGAIVPRTNEDGSKIILVKKYPSYPVKTFASFGIGKDNGTNVNDPGVISQGTQAYVELGNWRMEEYNKAAMDDNVAIRFISTPAKNEFPITYKDDFMKMIIEEEDVRTAFPKYVESTMNKGLDVVIDEVNVEAKNLGIK